MLTPSAISIAGTFMGGAIMPAVAMTAMKAAMVASSKPLCRSAGTATTPAASTATPESPTNMPTTNSGSAASVSSSSRRPPLRRTIPAAAASAAPLASHHVAEEGAGKQRQHQIDEAETAFDQMAERDAEIADERGYSSHDDEGERQRSTQQKVRGQEQRDRDRKDRPRLQTEFHSIPPSRLRSRFGRPVDRPCCYQGLAAVSGRMASPIRAPAAAC